ncbi:MAG: hypothetical protein UW32_C0002G0018 [Candidatus Wolfebacteria bacterium GW2011_GWE2_44_13]|uniref:Uncharacterized protein n=1 Tax=Candidatus Wolfebacteria bacterium GW2011_GWE2_44_13 TaxID=1619017 RepID=A0A0G1JGN5_9BACT|nr:MAG: hypothetical protein UW32_C0002G0018 [Candidatus Wolfebacteria bacterium GW2011_GWE2_44_13]
MAILDPDHLQCNKESVVQLITPNLKLEATMAKEFKFPGQQRMSGTNPVCGCCNVTITPGQKRCERGGHLVHGTSTEGCAASFDRAEEVRESIDKAFSGMPADFFSEGDLRSRLNAACTVQSAQGILLDFVRLLSEQRDRLVQCAEIAFNEAVRLAKEVGRMLRVEGRVAAYNL